MFSMLVWRKDRVTQYSGHKRCVVGVDVGCFVKFLVGSI